MTLITGPLARSDWSCFGKSLLKLVNLAMLANPLSRRRRARDQRRPSVKMLIASKPSDLNVAFASLSEQAIADKVAELA